MHEQGHSKTFTVVICADADVADAVMALVQTPGVFPPVPPLQATDGRCGWSAWNWPEGLLAQIALIDGTEQFPYTASWKAERGWVDQPPPEEESE